MPDTDDERNERKGAFILKYEGINASTDLETLKKRLGVVRGVLDRAVRQGHQTWGQKLRSSASIMLYIDAHQEVRRMLRPREEEAQLSKKERWMAVAKRARKVLDAQIRHCGAVNRLRTLLERVSSDEPDESAFREIPEEFPQEGMYLRYIKPLFGDTRKMWELLLKKRQIHERQLALDVVRQELSPKESPVPRVTHPEKTSKEREHDKA